METIVFPQVSGKNLNRERFNLPHDLPGRYSLVLIAFWQWQQRQVDTWLPYARVLERLYPEVGYMELPVITTLSPLRQLLINEGMRAGIPDESARQNTVTLYVDKSEFLARLQIHSQDNIQALLVRQDGLVLWRTTGVFSPRKGIELAKALQRENPDIINQTITRSSAPLGVNR